MNRFTKNISMFTKACAVGIGALCALAACSPSPIVIKPVNQVLGQVYSPTNVPLGGTPVNLYKLDGSRPESLLSQSSTGGDGTFALDFPRHEAPAPNYLVEVPSAYSFSLYGFAIDGMITVDWVSTALYEMIAATPVPVASLSILQIQTLLNRAHIAIQTRLDEKLIQPENTTALKLHKSYQNALAADDELWADLGFIALQFNYSLDGMAPYGHVNNTPRIMASSPKIGTPSVLENQLLDLSVTARDDDDDAIFYVWLADGVVVGSGANDFKYTPPYTMVPWNLAYQTHELRVIASDGGLYADGLVNTRTWTANITNVPRPPVFTSTAASAATEDLQWTYRPAAFSPDSAPFALSLAPGFPSGMDMCINKAFTLGTPDATPVWKWQVANTLCADTEHELVRWTPNNCQTLGVQNFQIQAQDASSGGGATGYQLVGINVADVNTPPTITTLSGPGSPALTAMEKAPWSYQPKVTDPQADPAALPGVITGSDPAPFNYTPGGRGCADVIHFSFAQAPPSATIDAGTGLVSWVPTDAETGLQPFVIVVTDGHGGTATQSFTVNVTDVDQPPYYITPADGAVIDVNEEQYVSGPFNLNIAFGDPDESDNHAGRLTLALSGAPPAMIFTSPALTSRQGTWNITDADTPNTWTISMNLCDANVNDSPLGAFLAPALPMIGPPHDHFCVPRTITLNAPKRNIAPIFVSQPVAVAIGSTAYTYTAQVYDGNVSPADTLTFSLAHGPAGMTLTPGSTTAPTGTATLNWTPNNASDLGYHTVEIDVQDGNLLPGEPHLAVQNFQLFVQEQNHAPTIISSPVLTGQSGVHYGYAVTATDPDATSPNNKLSYSLSIAPAGMTIDKNTGLISWTPTVAQAKTHTADVTVVATDGGTPKLSGQQSYTVALTYLNVAPEFSAVDDQILPTNVPFSLDIFASDQDGDAVTFSADALPGWATLTDNGDGSARFFGTPDVTGTSLVRFHAKDDPHGHDTTMNVQFTIVNTPVFQSHPVLAANTHGQYIYEVHALNPVAGDLTYSFDSAPGGMAVETDPVTHVTQVIWTPSDIYSGSNQVILRAMASDGHSTTQSWTVNVKTVPNSTPVISSATPDPTATVNLTESRRDIFMASATDADGDFLHFAWYWDGVWLSDSNVGASSTAFVLPKATETGDHVLRVDVTDGAIISGTAFTVHVRDAMPVLGNTYTFPGGSGSLAQFGLLTSAGRLVTLRTSPAAYDIFDEATFKNGPLGTTALPFDPQRMVLRNDFPSPTYFMAYLAKLGSIDASGNQYLTTPSDTLSTNICTAPTCRTVSFESRFPAFGGTPTVYHTATNTRFNIKPGARNIISSATSEAPNADIDLGAGVVAGNILLDTTDVPNRIFVTIPALDEIVMIDPTTRAPVAGSPISLDAGTRPSAMYFNAVTKMLYVYGDGTGALIEIRGSTGAVTATNTGFPAAPSSLYDQPQMISGNDADNIVYIANADAGKLITFDVTFGGVKSMPLPGASAISFDPGTARVIGASGAGKTIFSVK